MIAIIDYGMGNLRSVQKALEKTGADARVTQDPEDIQKADKIVLPGVGHIQPAIERLKELGFVDAMRQAVNDGKPFLGICLGLQLLFERSREGGGVEGLGFLPGTVERFTTGKVPHMGWNRLNVTQKACPLFNNIGTDSYVYFCHSYFVKPADAALTAAATDYGVSFSAAVARDNLFGVQFHPEKSQDVGLKILKNFTQLKP